jgi:hypothetical protein
VYRLLLLGLITLAGVAGCASPPITTTVWQPQAPHIYVVRREQHTGIAIDIAQWPDRTWPLLADFPDARFLEFGRGDAIYYQAQEKTLSMTLGAAFWPSPSVIEVLAQTELDRLRTAGYDIVAIPVTPRELQALASSIARSFSTSPPLATGTAWTTAAGESRFYHARGNFHLFRLCNRWTAQQLRAAGCALSGWPVGLASQVMRAGRRCQAAHLTDAARE